MKKLLTQTQRAIRLNANKGFTLIELLVVIAIIAILASLAIPQYINYRKKASVSSYAEPVARACVMDYAAYCAENPGQTPSTADLKNCITSAIATAGGQVTVSVPSNLPRCQADGTPGEFVVRGYLAGVDNYVAECYTSSASIRCTVK